MYCITTENYGEKMYLAWQEPVFWEPEDDGYFWTSKGVIDKTAENSTDEHPFLFGSAVDARKHAEKLGLSGYSIEKC